MEKEREEALLEMCGVSPYEVKQTPELRVALHALEAVLELGERLESALNAIWRNVV